MHRRSLPGFTLVEMILYVSLCSLLLLSLSTLFSFLVQSRIRSQVIAEVNQQGFQITQLVSQTIRTAKSIETPSIGISSSTLSLTTNNALINPTVFSAASGTVFIKEAGNSFKLTNSRVSVSGLLFQNVSSASTTEKIIKVSFVITASSSANTGAYLYSKTFTSSATLRK